MLLKTSPHSNFLVKESPPAFIGFLTRICQARLTSEKTDKSLTTPKDIFFFFNRRINFIRQLFGTASVPYSERMRKIEAEEEPFVQPYSEDSEPAFLEEWLEAAESLQLLAYSCVSMLAASLHLYFESWVTQRGVPVAESLKKSAFKKHGWFAGYKSHFLVRFAKDFEASPVKLRLLEEVVLARNRIQHPLSIDNHKAQYAYEDIKKLRHPFFVDNREVDLFAGADKNEKAWPYAADAARYRRATNYRD